MVHMNKESNIVKMLRKKKKRSGIIFQDITDKIKTEEQFENSEEFYKNLYEHIPDSIVTINLKGYITSCNTAASSIFKYSKNDLLGKHFSKIGIIRVKDIPKYLRVFAAILRGKGTNLYEITVNDRDGISHIVESHISLIKKNNKISGVLAITRDITDRKKSKEELIESQKRYRLIAENTNDLIIITDTDKTFRYVSPSIKSLGYNPDELIGKDSFSLLHPKDKKSITFMLKQLIIGLYKPGMNSCFEYRLRDKSGIYHSFEATTKLVKDESGKHVILSISRDITEQKKAKEMLQYEKDFAESIIKTAQAIVLVLDTQGCIVNFNPYMEEISGYALTEMQGKDWFTTFLPKCDRKHIRNLFQKALNNIQTRGNMNSIVTKNGHKREIEWYDKTLKDAQGNVVGVLAIGQDSTERKLMEKELRQSEEKYRNLIQNTKDSIVIIDLKGCVKFANKASEQMTGYTLSEGVGMNVKKITPFNYWPKSYKALQKAKKGEDIPYFESEIKRKDGKILQVETGGQPILKDGKIVGVQIITRDITERKNSEEKIKKQNTQLKKLDNIKTNFLNTTSHELRTPVASIKGYIQMLLKQTLGEITIEQKKALEVILRNTNRLDNLIENILDISRLESGTMKFIPEKTDITKMIKEIIETMQIMADLKKIKIDVDIQKEIPDLIIDQERIKQVLINIVDNALKFSANNSIINIYATVNKNNVLFEVQDFGRGIPIKKQKKIFEKFYQVDAGTDRKFGGVGLGLTISKEIIDFYGGQIWVDSTINKGSSFKFSLPLQTTKDIEDDLQKIYVA